MDERIHAIDAVAAYFDVLSEPMRLRIMHIVYPNRKTVCRKSSRTRRQPDQRIAPPWRQCINNGVLAHGASKSNRVYYSSADTTMVEAVPGYLQEYFPAHGRQASAAPRTVAPRCVDRKRWPGTRPAAQNPPGESYTTPVTKWVRPRCCGAFGVECAGEKLVIASSNAGKLREIQAILGPLGCEVLTQAAHRHCGRGGAALHLHRERAGESAPCGRTLGVCRRWRTTPACAPSHWTANPACNRRATPATRPAAKRATRATTKSW